MENQARFDLNVAVENWRQELAAQPNLTVEVRRELETHLRDSIAGFRQRCLNDEESFWLARRRVGQPPQLGEEFVKANPAAVWRERAFWIVLLLAALQLWNKVCPDFEGKIVLHSPTWFSHHWASVELLQSLVYILPIICFVTFLANGRMNWMDSAFRFVFRSRLRFVTISLPVVLILQLFISSGSGEPADFVNAMYFTNGFLEMGSNFFIAEIWPLTVIALITWLMPTQNRRTPKRA
jgi:hypothetical protein